MLNQTTAAMSKNDPLVATYSKLQTALEQDFARASLDAGREITLKFPTKEKAVEYAKKNNISYKIIEPNKKEFVIKSYADNFLKN